jgi:oxygen-independent coproporphyrinogen-3 oxidase
MEFVQALCREIASFDGPRTADTVFFGGGTPSLLEPSSIAEIMEAIVRRFSLDTPEITIEANPDDITRSRLAAWNALRINRVSLGVQSFDDGVLRYLGRRHDAACARRACAMVARRFDHWGMDLIFGAPPVEAWETTLRSCIEYAPKHVAAYGLTFEPGTPFGARAHEAVDDDSWLKLYRLAHTSLAEYDHYEISNFARPGRRCRHNLIYWHNEAYAGFGPGAYSFIHGARSRNPPGLGDYLAQPGRKCETLPLTDREIRLETVIQHLRLRDGLSKKTYARRFGRSLADDYGPAVAKLVERGLVEEDAETLRPTLKGFEWNNEIGLALLG